MPVIIVLAIIALIVFIKWKRNKQLDAEIERRNAENQKSVLAEVPIRTQIPQNKKEGGAGRSESLSWPTPDFLAIVRSNDQNEAWGAKKLQELYASYPAEEIQKYMAQARIQLYSNAADHGNLQSKRWVAGAYYTLGQPDEGKAILWPLVQKNDCAAIKLLALQYTPFGAYGDNPDEYNRLIKKAATLGDAEAQCSLAVEYGAGGNLDEELKWYKLAAAQKYEPAYRPFADAILQQARQIEVEAQAETQPEVCQSGMKIVCQLRENAATWYRMAVSAKNGADFEEAASALESLGFLYSDKNLSIFDPKTACKAFYQAARICDKLRKPSARLDELVDQVSAQYSISVLPADKAEWEKGI